MRNYQFQTEAVTDVFIEIQSKYIELYSAKFFINAHFSGLRYLMFNWPVLSAALGTYTLLLYHQIMIVYTCLIFIASSTYNAK